MDHFFQRRIELSDPYLIDDEEEEEDGEVDYEDEEDEDEDDYFDHDDEWEEDEDEEDEERGTEDDDDYDDEEEWDEEENEDRDRDIVDPTDMDGRTMMSDVSSDIHSDMAATWSHEVVNGEGLRCENASDVDGSKGGKIEEMREFNRGEIDGLFCPICFEAWSSGGDHHVCCLPCGHIYGLRCIEKWLGSKDSSKCPQCKRNCEITDIRLLYATRIAAADGELQMRVKSLEAKCASLEKESIDWSKKAFEWNMKEAELNKQVQHLQNKISLIKGEQKVFKPAIPLKDDNHMLEIKEGRKEHTTMRKEQHDLFLEEFQDMFRKIKMMHAWHISQGHYPPPPREHIDMVAMMGMMHEWHLSQGHYPPPPPPS